MPGKGRLPAIMDKAVSKIRAASPGVNPYAVASSTLQKSGSLKRGSNTPTKQGIARGKMSSAQRQANPPKK